MKQTNPPSPLLATGFTLMLAGIVAHVATGEWIWTVFGVAVLLGSAMWSSALTGGRDE